jgi:hypothetical protein
MKYSGGLGMPTPRSQKSHPRSVCSRTLRKAAEYAHAAAAVTSTLRPAQREAAAEQMIPMGRPTGAMKTAPSKMVPSKVATAGRSQERSMQHSQQHQRAVAQCLASVVVRVDQMSQSYVTRFRGVQRIRDPELGSYRWSATVQHGSKSHKLGTFTDEDEAAKAYDDGAH